jgi:hypothetical protein
MLKRLWESSPIMFFVIGTILVVSGLIAAAILIRMILIVAVWEWVISDVFAGAVEQGFLPGSITLAQAFKLSLLSIALAFSADETLSSALREWRKERKEEREG